MTYKTEGNDYDFRLEITNTGIESGFSILAIDKKTKQCSSINNLNLILSELDINDRDCRFADSSWVLPHKLGNHLFCRAKKLLSDTELLKFLEDYLDLDREEGEWENIYSSWA